MKETWTDIPGLEGKYMTAEDVAFTYNTLKETSSVNDFSMLKQAEAIDDVTVVFEMERPFAIWSYTMAVTGIVPEHAYGTDYGTHPIGSGRYILKQWDKGAAGDSGSQPGLLWGCAEDAAGHDSLYGRGCGICGGARRAGGCGVHGGVLCRPVGSRIQSFWTVRRWTTVDLTSQQCRRRYGRMA